MKWRTAVASPDIETSRRNCRDVCGKNCGSVSPISTKRKKIGTFYAGGCVGFDTLAAQETLEYQAAHPDVRLVIVVPYRKQSAGWSSDERKEYERIKTSATEVICLAEHYFRGCWRQRNRYMVQRSSVCVCYLTKERGGTASTVKYALRNGLFVRNLAVEISCSPS